MDTASSSVKVSVAMITYNHERFIAQALDSALSQQTNFPFEIVIGEDYSTDRTKNIVLEYQRAHPEKIRVLTTEKNLGMHANFERTVLACKGEYLAMLEGDDYWTDPLKLKKQVDFLDAHPEYVGCCANAITVYEDGRESHPFFMKVEPEPVITIEDAIHFNGVITLSVLYRRNIILNHKLPEWMYEIPVVDYALTLEHLKHGPICFMKDVVGAYRIHKNNVWGEKSYLFRLQNTINFFHIYRKNAVLSHDILKNLDREIVIKLFELGLLQYQENNLDESKQLLNDAFHELNNMGEENVWMDIGKIINFKLEQPAKEELDHVFKLVEHQYDNLIQRVIVNYENIRHKAEIENDQKTIDYYQKTYEALLEDKNRFEQTVAQLKSENDILTMDNRALEDDKLKVISEVHALRVEREQDKLSVSQLQARLSELEEKERSLHDELVKVYEGNQYFIDTLETIYSSSDWKLVQSLSDKKKRFLSLIIKILQIGKKGV